MRKSLKTISAAVLACSCSGWMMASAAAEPCPQTTDAAGEVVLALETIAAATLDPAEASSALETAASGLCSQDPAVRANARSGMREVLVTATKQDPALGSDLLTKVVATFFDKWYPQLRFRNAHRFWSASIGSGLSVTYLDSGHALIQEPTLASCPSLDMSTVDAQQFVAEVIDPPYQELVGTRAWSDDRVFRLAFLLPGIMKAGGRWVTYRGFSELANFNFSLEGPDWQKEELLGNGWQADLERALILAPGGDRHLRKIMQEHVRNFEDHITREQAEELASIDEYSAAYPRVARPGTSAVNGTSPFILNPNHYMKAIGNCALLRFEGNACEPKWRALYPFLEPLDP